MNHVELFDVGTIENYLKARGLKYLKSPSGGEFVVQFAEDEDLGCELLVLLMANGSNDEVYTLRAIGRRRFERKDFGRVLLMCNKWNEDRRVPKAFLRLADKTDTFYGHVMLEGHCFLEKGIHQELFDDMTDNLVAAAVAFWTWLHSENGL